MIQQTVTLEAKPWYTSKLFWLGILQLVLGILETVKTQLADLSAPTLIGPVTLAPEADGVVGIIFGILTLIWRWKTKRPVAASQVMVQVPLKASNGEV